MRSLIFLFIIFFISCESESLTNPEPETIKYVVEPHTLTIDTSIVRDTITIYNKGDKEMNWSLRKPYILNGTEEMEVSWMSVKPMSGTLPGKSSINAVISIDHFELDPGTYTVYLRPQEKDIYLHSSYFEMYCIVTIIEN